MVAQNLSLSLKVLPAERQKRSKAMADRLQHVHS
jgi:hypothetical protein